VFPVVLGNMFHVFILFKKGECERVFFLLYNKLSRKQSIFQASTLVSSAMMIPYHDDCL